MFEQSVFRVPTISLMNKTHEIAKIVLVFGVPWHGPLIIHSKGSVGSWILIDIIRCCRNCFLCHHYPVPHSSNISTIDIAHGGPRLE